MTSELIEAWNKLNFECQSVAVASAINLSERVNKMEEARMVYNDLMMAEMLRVSRLG